MFACDRPAGLPILLRVCNASAQFPTAANSLQSGMAKKQSIPGRAMEQRRAVAACELCGRVKPLTRHHLIPRAVHRKRRFQKRYDKSEMQKRDLKICRLCHNGIHDLFPDEKLLAEAFNTKEALLADERLRRHIEWVKKQK
jgi:hypothetical protein